ncbi:MAG: COX15/CtaA family protein [Cytophagales bacterium]
MNSIKVFRVFGTLTLIFLFLLILAGGIVRATGSGMGCPDWPKCFGQYIPPTNINQVSFLPNKLYSKGVFIIYNNRLYYSKSEFTSSSSFNLNDWKVFEEHNYTIFNPVQTWIEALNRYLGVFVGFWVLGMFIYSFILYKKFKYSDNSPIFKRILIYSFIALLLVIIQGGIGKYLVSSNLKANFLIAHMLFTYTVIYAVVYVLFYTDFNKSIITFDHKYSKFLIIAIILTIIQTVLGTQVTKNVEFLFRSLYRRDDVIDFVNIFFYIHRSFSIILFLTNLYLFIYAFKNKLDVFYIKFSLIIVIVLFLEICFGVCLNYFNYPMFAQPLHLLFAMILITIQSYTFIKANSFRLVN